MIKAVDLPNIFVIAWLFKKSTLVLSSNRSMKKYIYEHPYTHSSWRPLVTGMMAAITQQHEKNTHSGTIWLAWALGWIVVTSQFTPRNQVQPWFYHCNFTSLYDVLVRLHHLGLPMAGTAGRTFSVFKQPTTKHRFLISGFGVEPGILRI